MYVEEKDRSWCSSSGSNDHRAVTIEVANDGGAATGWHVSGKAYNALLDLVTDICKRNGIQKLLWRGDKSLIGQADKQNMTVHCWFANKSCPGDYLYNLHPAIAAEVTKRLGGGSDPAKARSYTVAPGDTLSEIAARYGATAEALAKINGLSNPNMIRAGQVISLTATAQPSLRNAALDKLTKLGVIDSPDYWIAHAGDLSYLDDLVIKAAGKAKTAGAPAGSVPDALKKLAAAGVISAPDYWAKNYGKVRYLDQLIRKLAGAV